MNETAGLPPPPGVESNFHSRNGFNSILVGTVAICVASATVFTIMRIAVRVMSQKGFKLEDYSAITCWAAFVAYNGVALAIGAAGAGRHQWDVSVTSIIHIGWLGNIIEIIYAPAYWLAKVTVLLQYLHIFTPMKRGPIFWSTHFLIWSNFLFYTIDTFIIIFGCRPREKIWNFMLPGKCLNMTANFIVTGAWNVFSDFFMLILPLYAIWSLQIPLKRKLSVAAVFATGLFACIASILRLYYCIRWARTEDATYVFMQVALWGLAELTTVVLCGSAVLLPLFFRLLQSKSHGAASKSLQASGPYREQRGRYLQTATIPTAVSDNRYRDNGEGYIPLQERGEHKNLSTDGIHVEDPHFGQGIRKTIDIEMNHSAKS